MLTVDQARHRILAAVDALPPGEVALEAALGTVAAADVRAPHALPRFANSAMDGYAVQRRDVVDASRERPVALRLLGEVKAGAAASLEIEPGSCARIMTGAAIPEGANAVVPVEVATEEEGEVAVLAAPPEHGHVRPAGDDVAAGDLVVGSGTELGAAETAILASLGISIVHVRLAPRVAIVVTGDELVDVRVDPGPGQIRDSNSVALRALVTEAGGEPLAFRSVGDDLSSVTNVLREAAASADLVVCAGGVSVGRYDFVKEAVQRLGSIELWRVAMQPGKPVVWGAVEHRPFLGLPGNPVSVHICFEQFVRPVIRKMRGCRELFRPVLRATLTEPVKKKPGRLHFVRVALDLYGKTPVATPLGKQGSHIQSSLLGCHGVARFHMEQTELHPGDVVEVEVWRLPGR